MWQRFQRDYGRAATRWRCGNVTRRRRQLNQFGGLNQFGCREHGDEAHGSGGNQEGVATVNMVIGQVSEWDSYLLAYQDYLTKVLLKVRWSALPGGPRIIPVCGVIGASPSADIRRSPLISRSSSALRARSVAASSWLRLSVARISARATSLWPRPAALDAPCMRKAWRKRERGRHERSGAEGAGRLCEGAWRGVRPLHGRRARTPSVGCTFLLTF